VHRSPHLPPVRRVLGVLGALLIECVVAVIGRVAPAR
jgi:hypothetical protein